MAGGEGWIQERYVAGRGQSIVHLGGGREGSVPSDEDAGDSRNDRQVGERRRRVVDGGNDAGGVVARIGVRKEVAHDGGIGRLAGRERRGGDLHGGRLAGGHGAEVEDDPVLAGAVTGPQRQGGSLEGKVGRQRIGDGDTRGRNGSQVHHRESVSDGLPGGNAGGTAGHLQCHVGRNHRNHELGAVRLVSGTASPTTARLGVCPSATAVAVMTTRELWPVSNGSFKVAIISVWPLVFASGAAV